MMDAVVNMLRNEKWDHETDLIVKGCMGRPVFSKPSRQRGGVYKVVVGPMWTTHYRLVKDVIEDQDSTKTDDIEGVKVALAQLMRK